MSFEFPGIPSELAVADGLCFAPAAGMKEWVQAVYVDPQGPFFNPDHVHLAWADVLFVWSGTCFKSQGRRVVGTAQMGRQQGANGKRELLEWTYAAMNGGELPDFVVTLCAPYFAEATAVQVLAVIDHELYHCGQAVSPFGMPMWTKRGLPVLQVRGHDVEEFVGVAARWGAYDEGLQAMKEALNGAPDFKGTGGGSRVEGLDELPACGCGSILRFE